ncbi:MAG: restriction endonuclease [Dehalococcoidia bacterium]
MSASLHERRVSAAALTALKHALAVVFWYKRDLRIFLHDALPGHAVLATTNWEGAKRDTASFVVDFLASAPQKYQDDILWLIAQVAEITSFPHLARLEDSAVREKAAREAVEALRPFAARHQDLVREADEIERRRLSAEAQRTRIAEFTSQLTQLKTLYSDLFKTRPVPRGYALEKLLHDLFDLFDLDPKKSFRVTGEQIDGMFGFEGTDYLIEARWRNEPTDREALDALKGKVERRLDNTLGLFVSINGFSPDSVTAFSSGRRLVMLMDGEDLIAVLEGRIKLDDLLLRKRRHAAQTGDIYLRVRDVL